MLGDAGKIMGYAAFAEKSTPTIRRAMKMHLDSVLGRTSSPAVPVVRGSLKHTFCLAFSTQAKGSHHLQGNVQVYNVRIPVIS